MNPSQRSWIASVLARSLLTDEIVSQLRDKHLDPAELIAATTQAPSTAPRTRRRGRSR